MVAQTDLTETKLSKFRTALEHALDGDVRFDRFGRAMHATDASVYYILPTAVVAPRHAADVAAVVRLCRQFGVSITARGGGTSQAGQSIGAGVSLDFSRYMNQIVALDVTGRSVTVEPGIVLAELNETLKPHGLQLPLDLSTANRATIGGMIANNSAGTRSIIYGKTIDYVQELQLLLSDGSVVQTGPLDESALARKAQQQDLEGDVIRIATQLGARHEAEIERRFPKIMRRVGGYNLDEFVPARLQANPFNLSRLLVGSEGTLGLTLKAKLRLVPLPPARIVCCAQFEDISEALRATPYILQHKPSAVELVDRFILDTTKGRVEFEPLRDFIVGDPGAVLIIEFFATEAAPLSEKVDILEADLKARGLGHHIHRANNETEQGKIWELRRAALGLTMSKKGGDAKGISFVEDTAVAPEKLAAYIEQFKAILQKYETEAGFYAHASVGLLHIRPVINLKQSIGIERFEAIANEVADLVLEFGGALSGEHGDGLVRASFQQKMFGPALYEAFCQLKAAFDPENLFNPGKIVHAPAITENLRFSADDQPPGLATTFDFSDFGGLLQAAEQCSGVGACRKTLGGTMCPSYMATRNEQDSTRGRANALRLALNNGVAGLALADHELKPVMDLCLECKACKSECPTGVDMARLKSEFQHQYRQAHGTPFREKLLSRLEAVSQWGSRMAPIANWLTEQSPIRWLNEQFLGLDSRRPLPHFARKSFLSEWAPVDPTSGRRQVALFADTFNNFYEPDNLRAAAQLVQAAGYDVTVIPRVCCGRPLISKGFLDEAARQAAATSRALAPYVERGIPILFSEPSCHSAVIDDHPLLLRGAEQAVARKVASAAILVDEWIGENGAVLNFSPGPKRLLVHGHCHQKALVGMEPMLKMLRMLPESEVVALDSGCCGLAGLFGYEQYEISQAIGERRLFPAIRNLNPEERIVAPGFSCRHQAAHFTAVMPQTPVQLMASHLIS